MIEDKILEVKMTYKTNLKIFKIILNILSFQIHFYSYHKIFSNSILQTYLSKLFSQIIFRLAFSVFYSFNNFYIKRENFFLNVNFSNKEHTLIYVLLPEAV